MARPVADRWLARIDNPDVRAVVAACLERVAARPNNMARVVGALPWPKQVLFHVAYAAMRVIDDFVDDDFLVRPAA